MTPVKTGGPDLLIPGSIWRRNSNEDNSCSNLIFRQEGSDLRLEIGAATSAGRICDRTAGYQSRLPPWCLVPNSNNQPGAF